MRGASNLLLVVGLLALVGCAATRRHYIPREDVRAVSPRGWPAAQYTVVVDGKTVGESKVWSEGAFRGEIDDDDRTILHVGFEVENRSGGELTFPVAQCRVVDVQGAEGRLPDMAAHDEKDQLQIAAGQVGLIDLEFLLPRGRDPSDLASFRVDWTLATPAGTYAQSTPFRIDTARYYRPRYYYYDYYDPWWGFGTGFAVGVGSSFWWGHPWYWPHRHWHHWH